jgi:hypothetical protein
MRDLTTLDDYRLPAIEKEVWGITGDHRNGAFKLPSPIDGQSLAVVASDGIGWDHVSVSRKSRCPNWPEMEFIKRKFFEDDETVMQLHVPPAEHINVHPFTPHLWRPQQLSIPRPPGWMVAPEPKDPFWD